MTLSKEQMESPEHRPTRPPPGSAAQQQKDQDNPGTERSTPTAQSSASKTANKTDRGRDQAMLSNMQAMMQKMQESMTKSFEDSLSRAAEKTNTQVGKLRETMDRRLKSTEETLSTIEARQQLQDELVEDLVEKTTKTGETLANIPTMVREMVRRELGQEGTPRVGERRPRHFGGGAVGAEPARGPSNRQEEAYWLSRRTLQIYPVMNAGQAVTAFFRDQLGATEEEVADLEFEATPLRAKPAPAPQNIVAVTFSTVEQRDMVKRCQRTWPGRRGESESTSRFI